MIKFPVDAPKRKVIKSRKILGFQMVDKKEHISMLRVNSDGTKTPLTMPNHPRIKGSTLRTICMVSIKPFSVIARDRKERSNLRWDCFAPLYGARNDSLRNNLDISENGLMLT